MISSIDEYLSSLKHQMAGFDRASIQDALSDAEEYLRNALAGARSTQPNISEAEALIKIIDGYGMPEEVAMAYKQVEKHIPSGFGSSV